METAYDWAFIDADLSNSKKSCLYVDSADQHQGESTREVVLIHVFLNVSSNITLQNGYYVSLLLLLLVFSYD